MKQPTKMPNDADLVPDDDKSDKMPNDADLVSDDATNPTTLQQIEGLGKTAGEGALDLIKGVGEGALGTLTNLDGGIAKILGQKQPTYSPQYQQLMQPANTLQKIGRGVEQVGEFLIPGGAEEEGARLLAKAAPWAGRAAEPIAKMITGALSSGAVNKAQGGSFGLGAALGGAGSAVSSGLEKVAPALAEKALGITGAKRAFGKDGGAIGRAALDETRGVRPATINQSASDRIGSLYDQRQNVLQEASRGPGPNIRGFLPMRSVSTQPSLDVLNGGMRKFGPVLEGGTGAPTLQSEVGQMANHITEQSPETSLTPDQLGRLQQGFSQEFLRWNPNRTMDKQVQGFGKGAYGAMTGELQRVSPESTALNTRISNLMPVEEGSGKRALQDGTMAKVLGRFGRHTGALAGAGFGGTMGYREGGVPAAIAGGLTGLIAPEVIDNPEGTMAAARLFHSGAMVPVLRSGTGLGLQLDRKGKK